MPNPLHKKQTVADGIHGAVAYEYTDPTERLAATGFTTEDRNKIARDLDTDNLYILLDPLGPTWQIFGSGGGSGSGNVSGPSSTTDNSIVRWDGTDGYNIQDSSIIIDNSNNITGVISINGVIIENHALRHENGGADEIDGYNIAVTYAPMNYDAPLNNILGEHLFQIDDELNVIASSVVTDHGALIGLADDDHTQYLLVSGTRALPGSLDLGTNNIINVGTVDGVDISSHSTRHESGGVDEIQIENLSTLETNSNFVLRPNGSGGLIWLDLNNITDGYVYETRQVIAGNGLTGGGDLSTDITLNVTPHADGSIVISSNDIRIGVLASDSQHGNLGGGSLHDVATALQDGFFSSDGYSKLESIEVGAQANTVNSVFGRTGVI